MSLLAELEWRGLVHEVTDPDGVQSLGPNDSFYIGFDPTAPSFQVGNLLALIVSMHLSKAGLRPVILFGGATGSIGDPSGKSAERTLLSLEQVEANVALQRSQVEALWERAGISAKPIFVNNIDWTRDVSMLTFLRDIGKHFTVNYMIAKDVVRNRLSGDGISYTEFSYMLLQSFDFLHLFQNHSCKLQIGGSDQWGNITAGLELIRRKLGKQAYALSFPLVTDADGKKFGKSAGNAVWLDPKLTSPYKLHQFLLNVQDGEAIKLLRLFTFETRDTIDSLEKSMQSDPSAREAQKRLADSVCTLVHGVEATADAKRCAQALFGGSLEGLTDEQLLELFSDAPTTELDGATVGEMDIVTLVGSTVAKSKGEARRLIQAGGIYLDNERVQSDSMKLSETKTLQRGFALLRSGKKNYHLVKVK